MKILVEKLEIYEKISKEFFWLVKQFISKLTNLLLFFNSDDVIFFLFLNIRIARETDFSKVSESSIIFLCNRS
jgi:hypothetical protein